MIRISSEKELLEAFRPIERGEVALAPELAFPLDVKDYVAWVEPAGHRVFLVLGGADERAALGLVFRRGDGGSGDAVSMCEWCHAVRGGNGVGLLTAMASSRRRVGIYLCRDLSCKRKAEEAPGADDLPRSGPGRDRVRQITERMKEFARRNLF